MNYTPEKDSTWVYKEPAEKRVQDFRESLGSYHFSLACLQTGRAITKAFLSTPYDSVCVIDTGGRVLDLNEAAARRCGQPKINIIGKIVWEMLPAQIATARKKNIAPVFASGEPVRFEDERDGHWYDNIIYPVHSAEHRVICAIIVAHDITVRHKAEKELHRSKRMLEQAQWLASIGSWNFELATGSIQWSDELYHILGYAPGEFKPSLEELLRHVHPDDRVHVIQLNSKDSGAINYDMLGKWSELRIIARNGQVKYILGNVDAEYDDAGQPAFVFGTIQDITSRRQAEEELHRSKKMLDQAQRLAKLGSWEIDLTTRTIHWSDELHNMLGYAPGGIEPSFEAILQHIHPDDYELFRGRNTAEPGTNTYNQLGKDLEVRIIARDGRVKWVLGNSEADYDTAGAIRSICGTVQDITERRQMEEALRESEDKFRGLFLSMSEGILLCDGSWRIIGFNAALERITGKRAGDYQDKSAGDLIMDFFPNEYKTPETHEYMQQRLTMFMDGRDSVTGEFAIELEAGALRTINYNIFKIDMGQGCIYGGILRDITEMRRSEEKLQRLGRIVEESLNEIYILEAQTLRFIMANRGARENLGYTMQELTAMTLLAIKPRFSHDGFAALLEPLLSGEREVLQFETVHRRKDGSTYPVEVRLHRGSYDNKEVLVANVLDITRRELNNSGSLKN